MDMPHGLYLIEQVALLVQTRTFTFAYLYLILISDTCMYAPDMIAP